MKEMIRSLYPTLLRPNAGKPPEIRGDGHFSNPKGVIDANTFQSIELDKLFDSINHASTRVGQATVFRSLSQPLTSASLIRAKQDAVREIATHPALRQQLQSLLSHARKQEQDFYDLLYGTFLGLFGSKANEFEIEGFGYDNYIKGTRFMLDLVEKSREIPKVESVYLAALLDTIRDLADSRAYALASGPAYRTEKGMITRAEKGLFTPAIRFSPSLFKPMGIGLTVLALVLMLQFVPFMLEMVASIAPVFWLFIMPLSLIYIPIVGNFDRDGCIYPLRESFKKSTEVQQALDALGQLDELLSFDAFKDAFGHPMVLPTILEGEHHALDLTDVRNPILAKQNLAYVGNDIALTQARMLLITGPNSGGKTAFCKTLAQTQLLAQIGSYVPAEKAQLTVADHIYYQAPEISQLTDGEGRFGTELRRTRDIFVAASPQSFVIMDELSEGTTHEEKIEISMNILDGFAQKGNTTLLITHNHALVDRYAQNPGVLARQVEFRQDQPTYRVVEGISRVSHADRVARKIGFAKEDIDRHLAGSNQN
jgi:hypothetical protein